MEECIFCGIIDKKVAAHTIYENESVCCFLDTHPINKGHILVVPKIHFQEFSEVDIHILQEVIRIAQKMAVLIEEILHTDGITVLQENGIFKDIEHYHIHIIPRYRDDGFYFVEPETVVTQEDSTKLKEQMRVHLDTK